MESPFELLLHRDSPGGAVLAIRNRSAANQALSNRTAITQCELWKGNGESLPLTDLRAFASTSASPESFQTLRPGEEVILDKVHITVSPETKTYGFKLGPFMRGELSAGEYHVQAEVTFVGRHEPKDIWRGKLSTPKSACSFPGG